MGLREDKKRITRKAISDLATKLFIKKGYDSVTTAEIARLANVSVPTLFKYFPTKEALVFDEDAERKSLLIETVKKRKKKQSIGDALLKMGLRELDDIHIIHKKEARAFLKMVKETPALKLFEENMWLRHGRVLALAIRKESKNKMSLPQAEAISRFILDAFNRSVSTPQPKATLKALFGILRNGWKE